MTLERGTISRDSDDAQGRFVKGFAGGKTGGVDLAARTVTGTASTINLDRHGEIVLPSAFKAKIGKFLGSNAPMLAAHTHRTDDATPSQIGWVMTAAIAADRVTCTFRFADDPTGPAERWWKLASDPDGKGIAFSIGFIPDRWVYGSVADLVREFPEIRQTVAANGYGDDDKLRVYTLIELLEISAVPVPANRESLQTLMQRFYGDDCFKDEPGKTGRNSDAAAVDEKFRQLHSKIDSLTAAFRDGMSEISEILTLSSDTLNLQDPHEAHHAPSACGEDAGGDDDGDGADDVRASAARLRDVCRSVKAG